MIRLLIVFRLRCRLTVLYCHVVSVGKPVAASDDAEVQKQRAEAAKQRHFVEQQRRLQEYGSLGGRKVNADTLIESILGKSEPSRQTAHSVSKSATSELPAVESTTDVSCTLVVSVLRCDNLYPALSPLDLV